MKRNKTAALLGMLLAATGSDDKSLMNLTNPYAGLDFQNVFSNTKNRATRKSPLTNKQKKSRAASKAARKSRRKNRQSQL